MGEINRAIASCVRVILPARLEPAKRETQDNDEIREGKYDGCRAHPRCVGSPRLSKTTTCISALGAT